MSQEGPAGAGRNGAAPNRPEDPAGAPRQAIQLDASLPDAYLILGIAQCENKQKAEGFQNIQKAKELGNKQAETFLQKYK